MSENIIGRLSHYFRKRMNESGLRSPNTLLTHKRITTSTMFFEHKKAMLLYSTALFLISIADITRDKVPQSTSSPGDSVGLQFSGVNLIIGYHAIIFLFACAATYYFILFLGELRLTVMLNGENTDATLEPVSAISDMVRGHVSNISDTIRMSNTHYDDTAQLIKSLPSALQSTLTQIHQWTLSNEFSDVDLLNSRKSESQFRSEHEVEMQTVAGRSMHYKTQMKAMVDSAKRDLATEYEKLSVGLKAFKDSRLITENDFQRISNAVDIAASDIDARISRLRRMGEQIRDEERSHFTIWDQRAPIFVFSISAVAASPHLLEGGLYFVLNFLTILNSHFS